VEPIVQLLAREGLGKAAQLDRLLLKCPQVRSAAPTAPRAAFPP
jgi:hypothetical protein